MKAEELREKAISEIVGDKLSKEDRIIPEHYVLATLEWMEEYAQSQLPKEGEGSKQKIIGWLKSNDYERIEQNSYVNNDWNVVLEDNQIAIADGMGNADYLPGFSLYTLIGYFTYKGIETTLSLPTEEEIEEMIKDKSAEVAERINATTDPNIKDDVYDGAFKEIAKAILTLLKEKR